MKDIEDKQNLTLHSAIDAYRFFHMVVEQGKQDNDIAWVSLDSRGDV